MKESSLENGLSKLTGLLKLRISKSVIKHLTQYRIL
ncbi:hypothetical protein JOC27_001846 [Sporolactobacillus spathodeae]|uniref:Uncharacterized protein n=1 Tax=Sporolactobacillus spathodeae TaxID=1465502 RepID=A0ABS2Q9I9_9BACL|nr:hypothetical protein [Sporolactobacillus spathodeae]